MNTTESAERDMNLDLENGTEMDCVKCGLSADVETDTWHPIWLDGGRSYGGMKCGRC